MATLAVDEVRFQQLVHVHHVIFVSLKTEFRGVHAGSVLSLYMQVVLEAEDEHDAASEEEEEEDDGGAEEVTASAPRGKRSLCCYSRIKHRIRRLFACL